MDSHRQIFTTKGDKRKGNRFPSVSSWTKWGPHFIYSFHKIGSLIQKRSEIMPKRRGKMGEWREHLPFASGYGTWQIHTLYPFFLHLQSQKASFMYCVATLHNGPFFHHPLALISVHKHNPLSDLNSRNEVRKRPKNDLHEGLTLFSFKSDVLRGFSSVPKGCQVILEWNWPFWNEDI